MCPDPVQIFDYWEELRNRVLDWRHRTGCSQTNLAAQIQISQSALSAFERGTSKTLRPAHHSHLSEILGEDVSNIHKLGAAAGRKSRSTNSDRKREEYIQNFRRSIATKLCGPDTTEYHQMMKELAKMSAVKLIRTFIDLESDCWCMWSGSVSCNFPVFFRPIFRELRGHNCP